MSITRALLERCISNSCSAVNSLNSAAISVDEKKENKSQKNNFMSKDFKMIAACLLGFLIVTSPKSMRYLEVRIDHSLYSKVYSMDFTLQSSKNNKIEVGLCLKQLHWRLRG